MKPRVYALAVPLVLLFFLCLAAYAGSLTNDFVWDDGLLIQSNPRIESFSNIPQVFKEDLFYMSAERKTGYYRPILIVSYMFDYVLWKRNPFGFHLTNVLLQFVTAVIVFFLFRYLMQDKWKGFFVASLFSVHPAFYPIVGYVAGRSDILGLFFGILSFYLAVLSFNDEKKRILVLPSLISYGLAILSREYYLIMPLFSAAYLVLLKKDHLPKKLISLYFGGCLSLLLIYLWLRVPLLNTPRETGGIAGELFWIRVGLLPYIVTNYLITLLVPFDVHMGKGLVYQSLAEPRFILSDAAAIGLICFLWYFSRKGKNLEKFFLSWFLIAIIPLSHLLYPLSAVVADHWIYLGSLGIFGILSCYWRRWLIRWGKVWGIVGLVGLVSIYAGVTVYQGQFWKDEEVFFKRLIEKNPRDGQFYYNLGWAYEKRGDYPEALTLYDQAIRMRENALFFWSRGHLELRMGQLDKALSDFQRAVQLKPDWIDYHNDLGVAYAKLGMLEKAKEEWLWVLKFDPKSSAAQRNIKAITRSSSPE